MSSFTSSQTQTFTLTHAKYLASKMAADLKRMQRFYGAPSDPHIAALEGELTEILKGGYLNEITYGFQRSGSWIEPTLIYTAKDLNGMNGTDDDPGRIRAGADISNASFHSYLIKNYKFLLLSETEQKKFLDSLPVSRTGTPTPGIRGYLSSDKSYSSGGQTLDRSSLKTY